MKGNAYKVPLSEWDVQHLERAHQVQAVEADQ